MPFFKVGRRSACSEGITSVALHSTRFSDVVWAPVLHCCFLCWLWLRIFHLQFRRLDMNAFLQCWWGMCSNLHGACVDYNLVLVRLLSSFGLSLPLVIRHISARVSSLDAGEGVIHTRLQQVEHSTKMKNTVTFAGWMRHQNPLQKQGRWKKAELRSHVCKPNMESTVRPKNELRGHSSWWLGGGAGGWAGGAAADGEGGWCWWCITGLCDRRGRKAPKLT